MSSTFHCCRHTILHHLYCPSAILPNRLVWYRKAANSMTSVEQQQCSMANELDRQLSLDMNFWRSSTYEHSPLGLLSPSKYEGIAPHHFTFHWKPASPFRSVRCNNLDNVNAVSRLLVIISIATPAPLLLHPWWMFRHHFYHMGWLHPRIETGLNYPGRPDYETECSFPVQHSSSL